MTVSRLLDDPYQDGVEGRTVINLFNKDFDLGVIVWFALFGVVAAVGCAITAIYFLIRWLVN